MSISLPGVIIAAPASGSGKSTVTLGLLRHLRAAGASVVGAKVGPDYIDPAFHAAASGKMCRNLDGWAMGPATLAATGRDLEQGASLAICEGVMGLFDGAAGGGGSTADIAALTGWPVVLVIDARAQAASAAATLRGFASHRDDVRVAGVIFNRVASAAHGAILREACATALPHIVVLGVLPCDARLTLPERHLGLVPAGEHGNLDAFLVGAAAIVAEHIDIAALTALAQPWELPESTAKAPLPALGGRIAVAMDGAFSFHYPAVLDGWRCSAEIVPFSPLADEAPDPTADAVYLPGGYPELHAGRLAGNGVFLGGLRASAARGAAIYGECGGYMVLGAGLTDASGVRHAMAGLLDLETSFAERRLHLGYRKVCLVEAGPLGMVGSVFRGHEFHYSTILDEGGGHPLFYGEDSKGRELGGVGRRHGAIMGSFVHLIDRGANG